MKDGVEVKTMGPGSSFGENALLSSSSTRSMTIRAKSEAICVALGREVLN